MLGLSPETPCQVTVLAPICPGGNIESTRSSVRFTFSMVSAVVTEVGKFYFVTALPGRIGE